ncbi:MAG: alpha/beta fold hydrolase [Shewanella oncorhynchi]
MPKVINQGLSIHYLEWGQADKPALILVFGFGMSALDWFDLGYISLIEPHFRIIAIEPRGHGLSDAPVDSSEYALSAMASDLDAVITHLRLDKVIVWGYSLGAKIALAYAGQTSRTQICGLILGGFEFHSEVDLPNDLVANTLNQTSKEWLLLWQSMFHVPPPLANRLSRAKLPALRALRKAESDWPDLSTIPAKLSMPCLLYAGEQCFFRDQTLQMTASFLRGEYLERENRNHFELMLDANWICSVVINHHNKLKG